MNERESSLFQSILSKLTTTEPSLAALKKGLPVEPGNLVKLLNLAEKTFELDEKEPDWADRMRRLYRREGWGPWNQWPSLKFVRSQRFARLLVEQTAACRRLLACETPTSSIKLRPASEEVLLGQGRTPFNTAKLRDWAASRLLNPAQTLGLGPVVMLGEGPFAGVEFRGFLEQNGIEVILSHPSKVNTLFEGELPSATFFILGREGVSKQALQSIVETSTTQEPSNRRITVRKREEAADIVFIRPFGSPQPAIYSQGLFLLRLFAPSLFHKLSNSLLTEHSLLHPNLALLREFSGFAWVSTDVSLSQHSVGDADWPDEGMLKRMGYSVGASGKDEASRRLVLEAVYHCEELPDLVSQEYVAKWGNHESSTRLRQIAITIASLCRNLKRRNVEAGQAVKNWEDDLEWLKRSYYDGRYDNDFKWPLVIRI